MVAQDLRVCFKTYCIKKLIIFVKIKLKKVDYHLVIDSNCRPHYSIVFPVGIGNDITE